MSRILNGKKITSDEVCAEVGNHAAGTGMRRNYEERQKNGKTSGLTSDGVIVEVCGYVHHCQ